LFLSLAFFCVVGSKDIYALGGGVGWSVRLLALLGSYCFLISRLGGQRSVLQKRIVEYAVFPPHCQGVVEYDVALCTYGTNKDGVARPYKNMMADESRNEA
jgi:hypothetical protein